MGSAPLCVGNKALLVSIFPVKLLKSSTSSLPNPSNMPTSWHWSFGDGNLSTATSPIHTFAGPGSYTVCLIVSNQYGADTLCRDIQVDNISNIVNLPIIIPQAKVSPNPFNDELHIQLPALLNGIQSQFRLIDMFGRKILLTTLTDFDNTILVSTIPSGLYIWQMSWNGKVYQVGKMVKM